MPFARNKSLRNKFTQTAAEACPVQVHGQAAVASTSQAGQGTSSAGSPAAEQGVPVYTAGASSSNPWTSSLGPPASLTLPPESGLAGGAPSSEGCFILTPGSDLQRGTDMGFQRQRQEAPSVSMQC